MCGLEVNWLVDNLPGVVAPAFQSRAIWPVHPASSDDEVPKDQHRCNLVPLHVVFICRRLCMIF